MRLVYLALVVFVLVLALGIVSAARSFDPAPRPFCGQCTQDSDCGTGHKCCGPSNCLECFEVVTCP